MLRALEAEAGSARPGSPDRRSEGPPRGQSAGAGLRVGGVPGRGPACACSGGGRARGPAPSGLRAPGAAPLSPLPGSGSVVLPSGRWEALCPPAALALAPPAVLGCPWRRRSPGPGGLEPLQAADGSRVRGFEMPVDHRGCSAAAVERELLAGPRTDRARGSRRASAPPAPRPRRRLLPARPAPTARPAGSGGEAGPPATGPWESAWNPGPGPQRLSRRLCAGSGSDSAGRRSRSSERPWRGRPGLHPAAPTYVRSPGSCPCVQGAQGNAVLRPWAAG